MSDEIASVPLVRCVSENKFIRLLFTRGLPLFFRPAAVMAEGLLLDDAFILVVAIPLVAMILLLSSLPIHIDYFKALGRTPHQGPQAVAYVSALTYIMGLTSLLTTGILIVLFPTFTLVFIVAIVLAYISEKYVDELSRWFEFQRQFGFWFLVQAFRAGWLFVPIGLAYVGFSYELAFCLTTLCVALISLVLYVRVFQMRPQFSALGLEPIKAKWFYSFGASLPALYRQAPRLLIASLFPSVAHLYLTVAQFTQAASLIFDVRVLIPYRRMSARHPRLFHRIWGRKLLALHAIFGGVAIVYIPLALLLPPEWHSLWLLGALLTPILAAEAVTLSIFLFNVGLMPWFVPQVSALVTYVICLALYGIVLLLAVNAGLIMQPQLILLVPAANLLIGVLWRSVVVYRHFD